MGLCTLCRDHGSSPHPHCVRANTGHFLGAVRDVGSTGPVPGGRAGGRTCPRTRQGVHVTGNGALGGNRVLGASHAVAGSSQPDSVVRARLPDARRHRWNLFFEPERPGPLAGEGEPESKGEPEGPSSAGGLFLEVEILPWFPLQKANLLPCWSNATL